MNFLTPVSPQVGEDNPRADGSAVANDRSFVAKSGKTGQKHFGTSHGLKIAVKSVLFKGK